MLIILALMMYLIIFIANKVTVSEMAKPYYLDKKHISFHHSIIRSGIYIRNFCRNTSSHRTLI